MVRVQPHLLPLVGRQRTRLLPDPRVDRDPSEVVDGRRASDRAAPAASIRQRSRRRARQLGDAGRVPCKVGGDQVREVTDRRQGAVDRLALQRQRGLGSRASVSSQASAFVDVREDLLGTVREAVGDLGIERMARSLADDPHGELIPAQHALQRGVASHLGDPHGSGISSPFARRSYPLPSQRSVRWTNSSTDRLREPEPLGQHLRHLADRGQVGVSLPSPPSAAGARSGSRARAPNSPASAVRGRCPIAARARSRT